MQHLIVATRNSHKTHEIREILGSDFEVHDLWTHPEIPETPESGKTFAENAILKATGASKELPGFVIADDSGLEVDALNGAPGVLSARYARENASDNQNIDKLIRELKRAGAERNRCPARFRCVIALSRHSKLLGTFEGTVEGVIVDPPRGSQGFGYDPIFRPNGFDQTFAELSAQTKNEISHRAQAAKKLVRYFNTMRPSV